MLPYLAFARQLLPDVRAVQAASIRAWAALAADAILGELPDQAPWSLHVFPTRDQLGATRMGARAWHTRTRAGERPPTRAAEPAPAAAGPNRCRLIRETVVELLQKKRRHLARHLRLDAGPFFEHESLVQLALTTPDQGFLSIAKAPLPFEQRHVLSFFVGGEVPLASDKQAPSRAFAKLVEAEARLGRRIAARETCVDLGASPGSWTYVAVRRGARVIAVDRAELRPDLAHDRRVRFQRGDAFRFEPTEPVDWLLCDVIATADRSAALLLHWLRNGWCKNFVVTLKVDDAGSPSVLEELEQQLPGLAREVRLLRLCANKKEVCAFGSIE